VEGVDGGGALRGAGVELPLASARDYLERTGQLDYLE